jgi:hypothetical protein
MGKHGDKKREDIVAGSEKAREKGCNCIDLFTFNVECPLHRDKALKQRECIIKDADKHLADDKTGLFTAMWLNSIGAPSSKILGCTCEGSKALENTRQMQYAIDSECPVHGSIVMKHNIANIRKNIEKAEHIAEEMENWGNMG